MTPRCQAELEIRRWAVRSECAGDHRRLTNTQLEEFCQRYDELRISATAMER